MATFNSKDTKASNGAMSQQSTQQVTFSVPNEKTDKGTIAGTTGTKLAVRKWLSVNVAGESSLLELGKLRVTHTLGVQLRDLRLLDPMLATSYPSAILARERALVVNLEFVKCIITTECCYITNLDDPHMMKFVEELQRRLSHPPSSLAAFGVSPSVVGLDSAAMSLQPSQSQQILTSAANLAGTRLPTGSLQKELPFELRVLECIMDVVSGYVEQLAADLEAAAHPALDALTQKINTSNLERVRRIKNRMVRLTTRVETLKELLEKILDDDSDLKDLCLSAKEEEIAEMLQRQNTRYSASATPFDVPLPTTGSGVPELPDAFSPLTPKSMDTRSSASTDLEDDENVAMVEMLLEPYFMQIDNTWNKLQTLTEYVDDTEDFINIELDSHRNQLIRLDLVLTAMATSLALVTAATSLFAMNMNLRPEGNPAPYSWFITISTSVAVLAVVSFAAVMGYCRWKRLI